MNDFGGDPHEISSKFDSDLIAGSKNLYEVLEVSSDSTPLQIRESFIRLKNTYSNSNPALYSIVSNEDMSKCLEEIDQAYRVLYDEHERKKYDTYLLEQRSLLKGHNTKVVPMRRGPVKDFENNQTEESKNSRPRKIPQAPVSSAIKMRYSGGALDQDVQLKINALIKETELFDGIFMKKLREVQEVSLDELQDRTKVSLQHIIAIECNDLKTLPSHVYVKGFIKICLQYLGVKQGADRIIQSYMEFFKGCQET